MPKRPGRYEEGRIIRPLYEAAPKAGSPDEAALTTWRVLERFPNATLIRARLGTGRNHQIRVHLSAVGHPVLGDRTYGKKVSLEVQKRQVSFTRQMLHARTLGFAHPHTGRRMEISTPLPEDMERAIAMLEKQKQENSEYSSQYAVVGTLHGAGRGAESFPVIPVQ